MERVLLLLDNAETRAFIKEHLAEAYDISLYDDAGMPPLDPETFDLCIIDTARLKQFSGQLGSCKSRSHPIFLPVLLMVTSEEAEDDAQWEHVDERLAWPLDRSGLKTRLQLLLRLRRLSLENRRYRERLLRMFKAIEATNDAVAITDLGGQITSHNAAFTDLYGYTSDEINTLEGVQCLFPDPERGARILERVRQGEPWNGEIRLRKKNGEAILALLHIDCVVDQDERCAGYVFASSDVTNLRQIELAEREQRAMTDALRDTAIALTATLDLSEVFDRILENVGRVVPHDAANIMMREGNSAMVVRHRGYDRNGLVSLVESLSLQVDEIDHLRRMKETRQPLIIPNTEASPPANPMLRQKWMGAYVGAPIQLQDEIIGFINLDSAIVDFFTPIHADRLSAFAGQAAIAIQNAQLYEQAQHVATIEERQRIARELHDAVSQTLFSATVIAESLARQWSRDPDRTLQRLKQLHLLTRGALAETRMLLLELRPQALAELGLPDLIEQLVEALKSRKRISADLQLEDVPDLDKEIKIGLYRIAQEALNNVIKHSRATKLWVTLYNKNGQVVLSVRDNGRGFDPAEVSPASLGLGIMRERSEQIDATLEIASVAGEGTEVTVVWEATRNGGQNE